MREPENPDRERRKTIETGTLMHEVTFNAALKKSSTP